MGNGFVGVKGEDFGEAGGIVDEGLELHIGLEDHWRNEDCGMSEYILCGRADEFDKTIRVEVGGVAVGVHRAQKGRGCGCFFRRGILLGSVGGRRIGYWLCSLDQAKRYLT